MEIYTFLCLIRLGLDSFLVKMNKTCWTHVANGGKELSEIILGTGFGGITDIKTGPDGLLYILTFDQELRGEGKIYRISH